MRVVYLPFATLGNSSLKTGSVGMSLRLFLRSMLFWVAFLTGYRLQPVQSHQNQHQRFLTRFSQTHPTSKPLLLALGHQSYSTGCLKIAIDKYLRIYSHNQYVPLPILLLCLGVGYLLLVSLYGFLALILHWQCPGIPLTETLVFCTASASCLNILKNLMGLLKHATTSAELTTRLTSQNVVSNFGSFPSIIWQSHSMRKFYRAMMTLRWKLPLTWLKSIMPTVHLI